MMEQFDSMGVLRHFSIRWSNLIAWGYQCIFSTLVFYGSVGHLECIFIALHGSLWLNKDKGSIMKSAESGGIILTYS